MGRSGDVGRTSRLSTRRCRTKRRLRSFTTSKQPGEHDLPGWGDKMEAAILKIAGCQSRAHTERRGKWGSVVNPDSEKGLWWYVNGPLRTRSTTSAEKGVRCPWKQRSSSPHPQAVPGRHNFKVQGGSTSTTPAVGSSRPWIRSPCTEAG
jgi:hypothetical protein